MVHCFGRLVGVPVQQPGAMPKTLAGEMIITNLDHKAGLERHPFAGAFGCPPARATRRLTGKARRADQRFQLFGGRWFVLAVDRRGESDLIKPAFMVIEAQQQRSDEGTTLVVTKAANHTIRTAEVFDLLHAAALTASVIKIAALGDYAIECCPGAA